MIDIVITKYGITQYRQNQCDVAFAWGFKCMFCLGIYCYRLKGVYCGVDVITVNRLCSMFSIHLSYACYYCSIVPFYNCNDTPN